MKNVVVTGMGIVSCIGLNIQEVLKSLKTGKSGISSNSTYGRGCGGEQDPFPRADAAADIRRRRHTRGAGQGRGPLRAATDKTRRVRHGTRPASSIGFSWSAFDHLR